MSEAGPFRVAMMLASDGPGGAEVMTLRLAEELRRRGSDVVYIGPENGLGWLGDRYREAGFPVELVPIGHSWIDVRLGRAIMRVLRRHSIDVIHSHEFDMAIYGTACARFAGVPNVITMHGGLTVTRGWQRHVALRWAYSRSSSSVLISAATRAEYASDLRIPESTFTVVPNGVPTVPGTADAVRKEFACAPGETVLLAVGNLEENKGHINILKALVLLETTGFSAPWRLIIAGGRGGSQHEPLLGFIRDHGLEHRAQIVTGRNDVPDLQALADVFIMPSYREGMPMALLEAMVAGNPVIASRTGGIPEVVTHDVEGLLVPPGDVTELAAALQLMLSDGERRARMGRAAHARAHRDFTVAVMAERYLELYQKGVERTRSLKRSTPATT